MTTRKKTASRKVAPPKARPRASPKAKALAITVPVKREAITSRPLVDSQLALLSAMMAWNPARIVINQQAAFWEVFAAPLATKAPAEGKSRRR